MNDSHTHSPAGAHPADPPPSERLVDDINLAGALVSSGESVARIAWRGSHATFVFPDSPRLSELVSDYYTGALRIPARTLVDAIRGLKSAIVATPGAGGGR